MNLGARRFCLLAAALFLVRGIFYLSLFPLFEGWDEYQHVARLDFEAQHGRRPLIPEEMVPEPLLEQLVRYPHGNEQLHRVGALGFQEFWDAEPEFVPPRPPVRMYEDQQGPLYYAIVAPLWRLAGGTSELLRSVTLLRLLNLLLGTVAVYVALRSLCRLLRPGFGPQLLLLAAAMHPLFLQNVARVANDALAVLLATVVIALTLLPPQRAPRWRPLALGALLGVAGLAKATNLMLIPFVALAVGLQAPTRRRGAEGLALAGAGFLLLMGWQILFDLRHYGTLTGMIAAVENKAHGRGWREMLSAVPEVPWLWTIRERCVLGSLWQGGWSFVPLPGFLRTVYVAILVAGCAGWLLRGRRASYEALIFSDRRTPLLVFVLGLCALIGIAYFSVQSQATGHFYPIVPWYLMIIVPWAIALFFQGARWLPGRWLGTALPVALLLVYVGTELYGTLILMVPHYTGHVGWDDAWQRLSWLHVGVLGPWTAVMALAGYAALLGTLLVVALRARADSRTGATV